MNAFTRMLRQRTAGHSRRYHTAVMLESETLTVAEHSFGVALLVREIGEGRSSKLELLSAMEVALLHDLGEGRVADYPAPLKRTMPSSVEEWLELEEKQARFAIGADYIHSANVRRLVATADFLEHGFVVLEQLLRGNLQALPIAQRLMQWNAQGEVTGWNVRAQEIYEGLRSAWLEIGSKQAGLLSVIQAADLWEPAPAMDVDGVSRVATEPGVSGPTADQRSEYTMVEPSGSAIPDVTTGSP